jgi:hypothetical protein
MQAGVEAKQSFAEAPFPEAWLFSRHCFVLREKAARKAV